MELKLSHIKELHAFINEIVHIIHSKQQTKNENAKVLDSCTSTAWSFYWQHNLKQSTKFCQASVSKSVKRGLSRFSLFLNMWLYNLH